MLCEIPSNRKFGTPKVWNKKKNKHENVRTNERTEWAGDHRVRFSSIFNITLFHNIDKVRFSLNYQIQFRLSATKIDVDRNSAKESKSFEWCRNRWGEAMWKILNNTNKNKMESEQWERARDSDFSFDPVI